MGVHLSTVTRTLKQYTEEGLESVLRFKHNPASEDGRRKMDGKVEGTVVSLACSKAPVGRARWTNVLLAITASQELGMKITPEMVRRILKKNKLRPHKNRYWCVLPNDPVKLISQIRVVLQIPPGITAGSFVASAITISALLGGSDTLTVRAAVIERWVFLL